MPGLIRNCQSPAGTAENTTSNTTPVFVEMNFSRPGGTHAGANDDPALKRRAIIGLSLPGRAKADVAHPRDGAEGNLFPEFILGWTIGAIGV
jgi:hypothetical protein